MGWSRLVKIDSTGYKTEYVFSDKPAVDCSVVSLTFSLFSLSVSAYSLGKETIDSSIEVDEAFKH